MWWHYLGGGCFCQVPFMWKSAETQLYAFGVTWPSQCRVCCRTEPRKKQCTGLPIDAWQTTRRNKLCQNRPTLTVSSLLQLTRTAPPAATARPLTALRCSIRWDTSTPRGRQEGPDTAAAGAAAAMGLPSRPVAPCMSPVWRAALMASDTWAPGAKQQVAP
jgi:hypothetical protein